MPRHRRVIDIRRLSIRQSVYPVPYPKWRTEGYRKLKIGKKEARNRVTRDLIVEAFGDRELYRKGSWSRKICWFVLFRNGKYSV